MPIIWFNMNEIQANVTKTKMRVLVIMGSMLKHGECVPGIRAKMLEIKANVHRNQGQCG